ncbi:hypothetical protein PCE1_003959 [Barthelona sp. PCE]
MFVCAKAETEAVPDYYSYLGVEMTAETKEIKKAYRRLAKRFHPDKNKTEEAVDIFFKIQEAYETLGDAEKRKTYDIILKTGAKDVQYHGKHAYWTVEPYKFSPVEITIFLVVFSSLITWVHWWYLNYRHQRIIHKIKRMRVRKYGERKAAAMGDDIDFKGGYQPPTINKLLPLEIIRFPKKIGLLFYKWFRVYILIKRFKMEPTEDDKVFILSSIHNCSEETIRFRMAEEKERVEKEMAAAKKAQEKKEKKYKRRTGRSMNEPVDERDL